MVHGPRSSAGCERSRPLLSAHMDGRLAPAEEEALRAHLAGCPACQEELRTLRLTVGMLRELPPVPLPHSFLIEAPAPRRPATWYFLFRNASAAVAAVLVALLAFGYVLPATLPAAPLATSRAPAPAVQQVPQAAAPSYQGAAGETGNASDAARAGGAAAQEKAAAAATAPTPAASAARPGPAGAAASAPVPAAAPTAAATAPAPAAPAAAALQAQPSAPPAPTVAPPPPTPPAAVAPSSAAAPATEQPTEEPSNPAPSVGRPNEPAGVTQPYPLREIALALGGLLVALLVATAITHPRSR